MQETIHPGSIVVGVDGSRHGSRALYWAIEQARAEHRQLVVASVDEGHQVLRVNSDAVRLVHATAPDVDVVGLTAAGDPRSVLRELSRDAYLVVVGSHGRGVARGVMLGSVSNSLLRMAHCPVVVCRAQADGLAGRGVLLAIDDSTDQSAMEFAFDQASVHHRGLTVVHCVRDEDTVVPSDLIAELIASHPGLTVAQRVLHGPVGNLIAGRTAAWDLIVVGHHPVGTLGSLVTGGAATVTVPVEWHSPLVHHGEGA